MTTVGLVTSAFGALVKAVWMTAVIVLLTLAAARFLWWLYIVPATDGV